MTIFPYQTKWTGTALRLNISTTKKENWDECYPHRHIKILQTKSEAESRPSQLTKIPSILSSSCIGKITEIQPPPEQKLQSLSGFPRFALNHAPNSRASSWNHRPHHNSRPLPNTLIMLCTGSNHRAKNRKHSKSEIQNLTSTTAILGPCNCCSCFPETYEMEEWLAIAAPSGSAVRCQSSSLESLPTKKMIFILGVVTPFITLMILFGN